MSLLTMEQFDNFIIELGDSKLNIGRKSIIIDEMRRNDKEVRELFEQLSESTIELESENKILAAVNADLFRKVGQQLYGLDNEILPKEKSFSELVTIESLEKNSGM